MTHKGKVIRMMMYSLVIAISVFLLWFWHDSGQTGTLEEAKAITNQIIELTDAGRYQEAIPLAEKALKITELLCGPDHPDTAMNLTSLALLYQEIGTYNLALPLLERALLIMEKIRGADHLDTVMSIDYLALLYERMGDYSQALPLYERALQITENTRGPDHLDSKQCCNNLAALHFKMGDYAQALPFYEQALKITENTVGPKHLDTAQSVDNLAMLYQSLGRYDQAQAFYERALQIRNNALGPNHSSTIASRNNLALRSLYPRCPDPVEVLPVLQSDLEWGQFQEALDMAGRAKECASPPDTRVEAILREMTNPLELNNEFEYLRSLGATERLSPVAAGKIALHSGDGFRFHIAPSDSCYLYLFQIDSRDNFTQLFPATNLASSGNFFQAGVHYQIPSGNDDWFLLDEKTGTETIFIIASSWPAKDLEELARDLASVELAEKKKVKTKLKQRIEARSAARVEGMEGVYYQQCAFRHE